MRVNISKRIEIGTTEVTEKSGVGEGNSDTTTLRGRHELKTDITDASAGCQENKVFAVVQNKRAAFAEAKVKYWDWLTSEDSSPAPPIPAAPITEEEWLKKPLGYGLKRSTGKKKAPEAEKDFLFKLFDPQSPDFCKCNLDFRPPPRKPGEIGPPPEQYLIPEEEYPPAEDVPFKDIVLIRQHPYIPKYLNAAGKEPVLHVFRPEPLIPPKGEGIDSYDQRQVILHLANLFSDCSRIALGKNYTRLFNLLSPSSSYKRADCHAQDCLLFWHACAEHKVSPAEWIYDKFMYYKDSGGNIGSIKRQIISAFKVKSKVHRALFRENAMHWGRYRYWTIFGELLWVQVRAMKVNIDRMAIQRRFRVSDRDIKFVVDRYFPRGWDCIKDRMAIVEAYCLDRAAKALAARDEGRFLWAAR